ncbi:sensor histidine kinase [Corynebacterium halotolerans]|uniref:sensor histidine kinase n=1 Tax=Corynebacterium halotolerans TaxID=225326 RepID=UPI003CF3CEC5
MPDNTQPNPYAGHSLPGGTGTPVGPTVSDPPPGSEAPAGQEAAGSTRATRGNTRRRFSVSRTIPLRTWLVVLIISISGLGLGASSIAVSTIMSEVVYSRIDDDLHSAVDGWASSAELFRGEQRGTRPPTEFVVLKFHPDGSAVIYNDRGTIPDVSSLKVGDSPQTVRSTDESGHDARWRALATTEGGSITVVAKDLDREDQLLRGLNLSLLTISLLVLAVMAALGYYLIRRALRPLREVEQTARGIAAGDLDRRVPQWPTQTEVGQLAYALNIMLEQLQVSIETAQNKEEQMRRFVGDASHELRTPLTSVRGYTELYRSGATQDVDRVLTKIDDESRRMSVLVEDLLALTRAEGAKLEKRAVDLLELGLNVAGSARAAYPGREVRVVNDTSSIPVVHGDPGKLHQVLLNLVINGLVHGGPVTVVTLRFTIDDDAVVTEVRDDGRGMEPDVANHIFDRFYREDSSRSRVSGGSGLGLAIVKSLIDQHGGTISVRSQAGEGTSFFIRLPRYPD